MWFQHGDVQIFKVDQLPEGAQRVERSSAIVLRRGEHTGHAHTIIDERASEYVFGELRFVVIDEPGEVVHQEHGARTLAPGIYRFDQTVREYDHFAEEARRVAD